MTEVNGFTYVANIELCRVRDADLPKGATFGVPKPTAYYDAKGLQNRGVAGLYVPVGPKKTVLRFLGSLIS